MTEKIMKIAPTTMIGIMLKRIATKKVDGLVEKLEPDPEYGVKALHVWDLKNAFQEAVNADSLNMGSVNMEYNLLDMAIDYIQKEYGAGETTLDREPGYFSGF